MSYTFNTFYDQSYIPCNAANENAAAEVVLPTPPLAFVIATRRMAVPQFSQLWFRKRLRMQKTADTRCSHCES